jgi:hypothetical protein
MTGSAIASPVQLDGVVTGAVQLGRSDAARVFGMGVVCCRASV